MDEAKYFETIAQYKLLAKKEVGQNFLIDRSIAKRIVDAAIINPEDKVLEIGSGAGSLSYFLSLSQGQADLIDIDPGLVAKLQSDFAKFPNVKVAQQNALKADMSGYTKIIGNLPYYITSSLIEKCLLDATNCRRFVFMVQKEAADRILSSPGSKDYGPLSILVSISCKADVLLKVPSSSFVPAPRVESAVVALERNDLDIEEARRTYRFATNCFRQRRKTLLNNLKPELGKKAEEFILGFGIDPKSRPEELKPEAYLAFARSQIRVK